MLRPLHDRIVVKPIVRQISDVIHVENREKFNRGTIVAIGPKVKDAQVGNFVVYGNGTYLEWPTHRVDGQDYQLIQEADICMVVEEQ